MFDLSTFEKNMLHLIHSEINKQYSILEEKGEKELLDNFIPLQLEFVATLNEAHEELVGEISGRFLNFMRDKMHEINLKLFGIKEKDQN